MLLKDTGATEQNWQERRVRRGRNRDDKLMAGAERRGRVRRKAYLNNTKIKGETQTNEQVEKCTNDE